MPAAAGSLAYLKEENIVVVFTTNPSLVLPRLYGDNLSAQERDTWHILEEIILFLNFLCPYYFRGINTLAPQDLKGELFLNASLHDLCYTIPLKGRVC